MHIPSKISSTSKTMTKPPIEIQLVTGEKIRKCSIHITHTYAGWIGGVPTTETNQEQLSELPDLARKIFREFPVHVVPPAFKKPKIVHENGLGTPQLMPPFQIIALFDGPPISSGFSSSMIISWHQNSVAPLMRKSIRTAIEMIAWKDLAKDWDL